MVRGRAAIFLDRDGVVIENRLDYVCSWDRVEFIPGALDALAELARIAPAIVLVTNQSAIGQGLLSMEEAHAINRRLVEVINLAGGRIDGVYMCPHLVADGCNCRKPKPGLLRQAARDLDLNLSRSVMVGDAVSDLQAGRAAGVGQIALVRTGRGRAQELLPEAEGVRPFDVYASLAAAAPALTDRFRVTA